ncbi:hypothetical protein IF1G_06286 [Cordyceps javanica]|uniref:Uncharacterized protein n=1 Tax=Cordyceps javanica TaxID=43265 RepID=A0A545V0U1_9HYPO|nr:hypothetical protein IF1G_06286 [Cordyceps javanica]
MEKEGHEVVDIGVDGEKLLLVLERHLDSGHRRDLPVVSTDPALRLQLLITEPLSEGTAWSKTYQIRHTV